jgi:hypothetical protein
MGSADEIQTKAEFFAQLGRAAKTTVVLLGKRPDKRDVIEEIELQLDVMGRRAADPQGPTQAERDRINLAILTRIHFAPRADGLNGDYETGIWLKQLRNLAWFYQNWPVT